MLLKNKKTIETKLYDREGKLFGLQKIVILFDLTNIYFERKSLPNDNGTFGFSKEKRSDCKYLVISRKKINYCQILMLSS